MPKATKNLKKVKDKKVCCICLDTIDKEARITSCRHRYHYKCIKKWSKKENSCPQCKRRFNWIIYDKKRVSVKRRNQSEPQTSSILSRILEQFFISERFREVIRDGIIQKSKMAIDIFYFILEATFAIRENELTPPYPEHNVNEAYSWVRTTTDMMPSLTT